MTDSGQVYICSAGETFDSIALEIYGDEIYAAELYCANPQLSETLVFAGGEELKLPVVEIPDEDSTEAAAYIPPWKEG